MAPPFRYQKIMPPSWFRIISCHKTCSWAQDNAFAATALPRISYQKPSAFLRLPSGFGDKEGKGPLHGGDEKRRKGEMREKTNKNKNWE